MRILLVVGTLLLFLVGGCATRPTPTTPGRGPEAIPTPRVSLAAEQRRFADLFRDTPVVFEMQPDGSMRITVPLRYSFDKGRFAVKPPLAAVLDRVARSQRAEATRFLVAAPADAQSKGLLLATERATSARDYLVARGVAATRFSISAMGSGESVMIVVADTSAH